MQIKVDTLKWFIAAISRFVSWNECKNTTVCHDSRTGSPVKSFRLPYRRDLTYIEACVDITVRVAFMIENPIYSGYVFATYFKDDLGSRASVRTVIVKDTTDVARGS